MMIMFFCCQVLAVLLQNGCQCCVVCNRFLRHNHCRLSTAVPLTKAVNITVNSGEIEREGKLKNQAYSARILFCGFISFFFIYFFSSCFCCLFLTFFSNLLDVVPPHFFFYSFLANYLLSRSRSDLILEVSFCTVTWLYALQFAYYRRKSLEGRTWEVEGNEKGVYCWAFGFCAFCGSWCCWCCCCLFVLPISQLLLLLLCFGVLV